MPLVKPNVVIQFWSTERYTLNGCLISSQSSVHQKTVIEAHYKTLRCRGRLHMCFYCVAGKKKASRQAVLLLYRMWAIVPHEDFPVDPALRANHPLSGNESLTEMPQSNAEAKASIVVEGDLCVSIRIAAEGSRNAVGPSLELMTWRRNCPPRENSEACHQRFCCEF